MEKAEKKRAIFLSIRVGVISLIAAVTVVIVAYYVLSYNFKNLLTEHTITLIESMTSQGVKIVENELDARRQEISFLADSFDSSLISNDVVQFPAPYNTSDYIRMVYVTKDKTIASDNRQRHLYGRQDINDAFLGQVSVYGPYFNEENEYVVCYSAPVKQGDEVVGVLSIEKDGYLFCELIRGIRFINSGESYIINAEGTDIAVSDQNHIDWVNSQYNARKLLESNLDEETKSILELEQKGLDGKKGIGTYYWHDGLVYVVYEPITSQGWVLLAGMREEELVELNQTAMFSAIANGPVLQICFVIMFLLLGLIIYWIVSTLNENAKINEKLKIMANHDVLTKLKNRNSFHNDLETIEKMDTCSFACIYIDANGLHELNNHLGHLAGDQMLIAIADTLDKKFADDSLYRIGGDEFVILCCNKLEEDINAKLEEVREFLQQQHYEVSIGLSYQDNNYDLIKAVDEAEMKMRQDKEHYYQTNSKDRRTRRLDKQLERLILDKQDADTFLEVLAPEFNGVYFVNLTSDTIRHLYIPDYFEECLIESDNKFSKALMLYAQRLVLPEYYHDFEVLCDYDTLEKQLNSNQPPDFIFQKTDGQWIHLRVLKFRGYSVEKRETLWIFAQINDSKNV